MMSTKYEVKLTNITNKETHWVANRSTASKGIADVMICSPYHDYLLAEVKGRAGESIYASGACSKSQLEMLRSLREKGFHVAFILWWKRAFVGEDDIDKFRVYDVNEVQINKHDGMRYSDFIKAVDNHGYEKAITSC